MFLVLAFLMLTNCITDILHVKEIVDSDNVTIDTIPEILPGTKRTSIDLSPDDLSALMTAGAHKLIDRKIKESFLKRSEFWNRDFSSPKAYELSVEPNRKRFMTYIGVEDKSRTFVNYNIGLADKYPPSEMQKYSEAQNSEVVAETDHYKVYQVRWPVLNGVNGEGLLIQPKSRIKANIIAIPDADQTPEQLVGLAPGIPEISQFARHLAENGYQVLVPVLINRNQIVFEDGNSQSNREWIYRQAFHMGKHPIGYEVQKVMSAVDWFKKAFENTKIGVIGFCEGGLIAFYSAAVDKRIDAVLVSGYFESRQEIWKEPIYRNVWGLLTEFGDAEIASLIAPRPLIIEYSKVPAVLEESNQTLEPFNKSNYTGYKGGISTPKHENVKKEFSRINDIVPLDFQERFLLNNVKEKPLPFGSIQALNKFVRFLGVDASLELTSELPQDLRSSFNSQERQYRQIKEIENHVQKLLRVSDIERNNFFLYKAMPEFANKKWNTESYFPYYSSEQFIQETKEYRKYFYEEVLGKFDDDLVPANARTKKIYDNQRWAGFEVVLDVYAGFISPGILLIPKNIEAGEKRPVVVIQHGRNGVPKIVVEGNTSYYNIASKLATQGFIVYAPYGLFKGEDQYRWLDRKANAIKKTLFSFIISQHIQILKWLKTLPYVDGSKIGFYGKSYGGETAMRIPAVLEDYALSICSADFGDWTRKVVDIYSPYSFMNTIEWEMPYFNMGSTFSYAEMAYLIFPRPFMVERGHHDLVQPDEWVNYEYGKVRFLYDQFNLGDKTTMEVFNGGHASRNVGTFEFLRKHLNWP